MRRLIWSAFAFLAGVVGYPAPIWAPTSPPARKGRGHGSRRKSITAAAQKRISRKRRNQRRHKTHVRGRA
jgi:hypothetical protein